MTSGVLRLSVVCEEFREADGDDLMVYLVLSYALRGYLPPADLSGRANWAPEQMLARVAKSDAVVVCLDCRPPSPEERSRMDEEYRLCTELSHDPDAAEPPRMPAAFSDDWVREVGPKCMAAIRAAQDLGKPYVVLLPVPRVEALCSDTIRVVDQLVEAGQHDDAKRVMDGAWHSLRCGDEEVRVPFTHFGSGPDAAIQLVLRLLSERCASPAEPQDPPSPEG